VKVNPIFKFILLVLLVSSPFIIGAICFIFGNYSFETVINTAGIIFMLEIIFIAMIILLWNEFFKDNYKEWKTHNRSIRNKER